MASATYLPTLNSATAAATAKKPQTGIVTGSIAFYGRPHPSGSATAVEVLRDNAALAIRISLEVRRHGDQEPTFASPAMLVAKHVLRDLVSLEDDGIVAPPGSTQLEEALPDPPAPEVVEQLVEQRLLVDAGVWVHRAPRPRARARCSTRAAIAAPASSPSACTRISMPAASAASRTAATAVLGHPAVQSSGGQRAPSVLRRGGDDRRVLADEQDLAR